MHTCDRAHVCRLVHTCVTVSMAVCAAVTSACLPQSPRADRDTHQEAAEVPWAGTSFPSTPSAEGPQAPPPRPGAWGWTVRGGVTWGPLEGTRHRPLHSLPPPAPRHLHPLAPRSLAQKPWPRARGEGTFGSLFLLSVDSGFPWEKVGPVKAPRTWKHTPGCSRPLPCRPWMWVWSASGLWPFLPW